MRGTALGLAALIFASAAIDHADARKRKRARYNPPYAAIVVDANTGKVLHESHADSTRYPASLTKVMTLFLLFERLEAGTIKLSTPLPVSKHAAAQAPSKLALKPGDTISVEDAIGAIVTKSANDVAVVVAEALGGTESGFARMMTRKAHILGMNHTTYVNASGLPDTEQRTTARDQARLGRAIQERFPKYYKYFQTRSFTWHGRNMRNHNKLLGRVEGVDGIKTGFTRASGFNLLTSVHRDGRYIVAAVFGGRSGRWRDARMTDLVAKYIGRASKQRTVPRLDAVALMKRENKAEPATMRTASAVPIPVAAPDARPDPKPVSAPIAKPQVLPEALPEPATGSTAPIKPNAVKTVKVKAAHMRALGPGLDGAGKMLPPDRPEKLTTVKTVKADIPPPPVRPGMLGSLPAKALEAQNSVPDSMPVPAVKHSGDYLIQVGAFDDVDQARHRLKAARTKARDALDKADPFTEPVAKGDKTLYRARFAGFVDRKHAEAACKSLRRGEIPCMLLKN
jgi:D-alanyl-D-alanine carboxypeptidase